MINHLKKINLLILLILLFFIFGLINFKESIPKNNKLIKNVDAVVVLTGDRGKRIQEGYELIKKTKYNKMFISGLDSSMKVLQSILDFDELIVECCIEVGHKAKNTYQNAIETKYWANNNKVKSIILITNDLHMQRSIFLFKQITNLEVHPYNIYSKNEIIPLEKLIVEYFKYVLSRIVFVKKYEN